MLIGSIYCSYIAEGEVLEDWPERAVGAMWPALIDDGRTGAESVTPEH